MLNESVTIVFFSGTGGTRKIAKEFEKQFIAHTFGIHLYEIDSAYFKSDTPKIEENIKRSRYIFVLFPIYAFDAPQPIYQWIEETRATNKNVIVISVSGGGEVWPNVGTRFNCITALEEKGFQVIYEKMMVMPSNCFAATNDHLAMWLIKVIPEKVNKIIQAVLSGKIRRTKMKRKTIFQSWISRKEKKGAHRFAKLLSIDDHCTRCGWCVEKCPVKSIEMDSGKPTFSDKCIICLRCIYGCPANAIRVKVFPILKEGFNLEALEKRMHQVELDPIEKCSKGLLWKGVKKYLLEHSGY